MHYILPTKLSIATHFSQLIEGSQIWEALDVGFSTLFCCCNFEDAYDK